MSDFDLGDKVKDIITGFTGITVSHLHYLYNQDRWGVVSQDLKDGKPMEPYYLDETSLELIDEKTNLIIPNFPELTIQLGDYARDRLSDFQGTVSGLGYWLNGCIRVGIQPKDLTKEGIPVDEIWFPMSQMKVIRKATVESQPQPKKKPGGPMKNPTAIKNPK